MSNKQDLKKLMREKAAQGWEIQTTRGGHFRLRHASGGCVTFPSTPSDHRSFKNTLADVKRIERAAGIAAAQAAMSPVADGARA